MPLLFSHFLVASLCPSPTFSLCGLCLAQRPQSLRAQIDIGDLVINMWVVDAFFFPFVRLRLSLHAHVGDSDRGLLSVMCT